jgi:threonine/homoserine/homoserine lactone efflux protein
MNLATWLAFAAASFVLIIIPGPTVLLVVSYALTQGRRVALAMAAGVAVGDFLAMTLSLAGLGALLASSATLFAALKWAGAAYLLYLGVKLWRSEPKIGGIERAEEHRPAGAIFAHAFVVTALNPKSIAFFVAFVPQFIDHSAPILPQFAIMEATFVGLGALNALAYALAADQMRLRIRRPGVLRAINRVGATFLVGMAAATATAARNGT